MSRCCLYRGRNPPNYEKNLMLCYMLLLQNFIALLFCRGHTVRIIENHQAQGIIGSYEHEIAIFQAQIPEISSITIFNGTATYTTKDFRDEYENFNITLVKGALSVVCNKKTLLPYQELPHGKFKNNRFLKSGFLIPNSFPHNESALSKYVLRLKESKKKLIVNKTKSFLVVLILRSKIQTEEVKHMQYSDLNSCSINFKKPFEQYQWPITRIFDYEGRQIEGNFKLDSSYQFDPYNIKKKKHVTYFYSPSEECSSLEKDHDDFFVTSFAQVQGMSKIVGGAIKMFMEILLDAVMGIAGRNIQQVTQSVLVKTCNQRVPPQVFFLAEPPVRINTTHLLCDASIWKISERLADSLTNSLSPPIDEAISQALPPLVHAKLHPFLLNVVSEHLIINLPRLLKRSLRLELQRSLTQALSHSLVASVTNSVSHVRDISNDMYCHKCYYQNIECSKCRSSMSSNYYNIYYCTYYADYYSDYYSKYYEDVLLLFEEQMDPEKKKV